MAVSTQKQKASDRAQSRAMPKAGRRAGKNWREPPPIRQKRRSDDYRTDESACPPSVLVPQNRSEAEACASVGEAGVKRAILPNVRVYAMFAGCIISRSGTASKYGWRLAEERSKP